MGISVTPRFPFYLFLLDGLVLGPTGLFIRPPKDGSVFLLKNKVGPYPPTPYTPTKLHHPQYHGFPLTKLIFLSFVFLDMVGHACSHRVLFFPFAAVPACRVDDPLAAKRVNLSKQNLLVPPFPVTARGAFLNPSHKVCVEDIFFPRACSGVWKKISLFCSSFFFQWLLVHSVTSRQADVFSPLAL